MASISTTTGEQFADLLRRFRARSRLSQAELAEAANLSTRAVSDLERGVRSRPYLPTVRALADALKLDEMESLDFASAVRRGRGLPERLPAPGTRYGVPFPISSFIDRQEEMALITASIQNRTHRLITVTGGPGVGKTRLALESARVLSADPAFRIVYLNLLEQRQPGRLLASIAERFGVTQAVLENVPGLIAASLRGEPCLLILDNLEHLLTSAGELRELLSATPFLTVLATSRAPTLLDGEQQVALLPLRVPSREEIEREADALTAFSGVSLFVARLQERTPALNLNPASIRKIAEIARILEGIPLALEIAAGYAQVLSLDDLGEIVNRPLDLGGPESVDGAPARHGTLRNAIDWSYRLLTPEDQWALRRLSILDGPFSIDDACDLLSEASHPTFGESVSSGGLGRVLHLAQQGLLYRAGDPDASIFMMLHLVQEYARSELEACGELADCRSALKSMALKLSETAALKLRGTEEDAWREIIQRRTATLNAALWLCSADSDIETGTAILWNIGVSFFSGPPAWARQWVEEALQEPGNSAICQGKLLVLASLFGMMTGAREPAVELAERGFSLLDKRVYPAERGQAFDLLRFFVRPPDLPELAAEADARVDELDPRVDAIELGRALRSRGMRRTIAGDLEAAEADFNFGLSLLPRAASATKRAIVHGLATVQIRKGELQAAQKLLQSGLEGPLLGTPVLAVSQMYNLLGIVAEMLELPRDAAQAYANALRSALAAGTTTPLRPAFWGAASLSAASGRREEAARLLGAAAKPELSEAVSGLVPAARHPELEPGLRLYLGDACFEEAFHHGTQLPLESAITEALEELERSF